MSTEVLVWTSHSSLSKSQIKILSHMAGILSECRPLPLGSVWNPFQWKHVAGGLTTTTKPLLMNCSLDMRPFFGFRKKEIILRADGRKLAWCGEGEDAAIHERTGLWNRMFKPARITVQPLFVNSYNYGFRLIWVESFPVTINLPLESIMQSWLSKSFRILLSNTMRIRQTL